MGRVIEVDNEAYALLKELKREGFSLKRLASEPIVEKYKPLAQAKAEARLAAEAAV